MLNKKIKTAVGALCFTAAAFMGSAAQAQIAGKNLILVHGLKPDQLMRETVSAQEISAEGAQGWAEFWGQYADDRLDWSSKSRLNADTAQLQSRENLVCRLLLEKKKTDNS